MPLFASADAPVIPSLVWCAMACGVVWLLAGAGKAGRPWAPERLAAVRCLGPTTHPFSSKARTFERHQQVGEAQVQIANEPRTHQPPGTWSYISTRYTRTRSTWPDIDQSCILHLFFLFLTACCDPVPKVFFSSFQVDGAVAANRTPLL